MTDAAIPLGEFELRAPRGAGRSGAVWLGAHRASGEPVAIKVLAAAWARDPENLAWLRSELRAVAALDHPGIVRLFDHGEVDEEAARRAGGALRAGCPYLVLEHVAGGSLRERIGPAAAPLPWVALQALLLELLHSLAYAHARQVVHRDLKPSNVLLSADEGLRTKLTDVGIALEPPGDGGVVPRDGGTDTARYRAPEQLEGRERDIGPWTDLYALGCLALEATTGQPSFGADPFEPRAPVPVGLVGWLERMVARDPGARYPFAAEAARALVALGAGTAMDWAEIPPAPRPGWLGSTRARMVGLRTIPLVDREQERGRLWRALSAVHRQGRAAVTVLHGPAGSGKSRLARWLCERAHELGVASSLGAFHGLRGSPGDGLAPMLARELRVVGLSRGDVQQRVEALLRADGVEDPHEWQGLAALVTPPAQEEDDAGPGAVRFDSPVERYVLVLRHLQRRSRRGPVVVWIDDAQWGQDALHFVEYLLDQQDHDPVPVLVLATVRDSALAERPLESELVARLAARAEGARLAVEALAEAHRPALVQAVLGLEPRLTRQVADRSGGNPLFAVQMIGDLVERGQLVSGRAGLQLEAGAALRLPDDLHEVWSRRIERHLAARPSADGVALELAAVLGRDVDAVEWARCCALDGEEPAWSLVEELLDGHLARCGPEGPRAGWSFVHGMLQESIVRRAREQDRLARHHRTCARMLRERPDPALSARLGHHLLAAGEADAAVAPLVRGTEWALERDELDAADLLLDDLERAVEQLAPAEHDERRGVVWQLRAQLALRRRDLEAADAWAARAEEQARAHGWTGIRGWAAFVQASCLFERGELTRGLARAGAARNLAAAARDARLLGACGAKMGALLSRGGNREQAVGVLLEALSSLQEVGHKVGIGDCMLELAYAAMGAGDLKRARRLVDDAALHLREAGSRSAMAKCLNFQGEIARLQDRLERAERYYRQSRDTYRAISSDQAFLPTANLGLVALAQQRYGEARRHLEEAIERVSALQHRGYEGIFRAGLIPCSAGERDWAALDQHVAAAERTLADANWVDPDTAPAVELGGDLARDAGETERARAIYGLARAQWQQLDRQDRVQAVSDKIEALQG